MADWLEAFVPLRIHVLVRFGRWDDLIAEPLPADESTCTAPPRPPSTTAAASRTPPKANWRRREPNARRSPHAYARIPESRYLFNNTSRDILAVAEAMLDGEIAYREGQFDDAFAHLRRAIELDDALPYDEPWGWMQPTRHAYGALLLEQGRVDEAADGVRRRPRARPHAEPALPAPRQRVEPARLPRMPAAAGPHARRRRSSASSSNWRRPAPTCRCCVVRVPARCAR